MAQGEPGRPTSESGEASTGISEFLGKVLDQLAVSAWLPAVLLISNLAILVQLHQQGDLDLTTATATLVENPLGILIVLLFAIIVATMITQAFAFESIRLLEGYWTEVRIGNWLVVLLIGR